jgi:hypothetical protein
MALRAHPIDHIIDVADSIEELGLLIERAGSAELTGPLPSHVLQRYAINLGRGKFRPQIHLTGASPILQTAGQPF